MPTLSEFFGITIRMYWLDHAKPHFHAFYLNAGAMDAMECEEYESHVEDEAMTKSKCRTTYRVKVKSKTSGRWRWALVGCNRKNMERAVRLYKEKFGETAKIVVKA